ncbi:hypothetical protein LZZ90_07300 [Flavobacterium sp. SM15]|uniref:hypothetical protein n=1 Tax=Flavobacterium sp. SM15 TaxID=2908005 RepID=UPI001EDC61FA|nr:hypothetical protein [Flavobacterium sp. SM15]MCG2611309.1 hypothetical protein [Flavobacterium sp. SM15]
MKIKMLLLSSALFFIGHKVVGQTYSAPASAGTGGSNNTNVGSFAGSNSTHSNNNGNIAIGYYAGTSNVSGTSNSFLGHYSGNSNISGIQNAFMGGGIWSI